MVTAKGLTREYGYAGGYGEMAAHIAMYYKYSGNTEFRDQSVKLIKAMANFRRPSIETSSPNYYRSMERIGLLAWRGFALFVDSYAMGETAAASIPFIVWPFKLGAFLFLALGTMEFVRQLVWSLLGREWLPPHPAVSEEIAR